MISINQLSLEELVDFISLNMDELRDLFAQNENQIFASIHHNIGLLYFRMIDEFDHLDSSITTTLGGHAKAQFEHAKSFAQDEEGKKIQQNMIDRVNFDIAALFKYDLNVEMNLHLFSTYFTFFTDALDAYRRNKNLCSKEDMLELTQFTLATINSHYFALARFHIPNLLFTKLPDLKRCLLNLSRTAGNKQDAILWMEKYRLIEAHLVCLGETNEPLPAITSDQEGLFPSLQAQNMFSSSTFSGFEDLLGQFSQDTQHLLETRDCLFFPNNPKI